MTPWRTIRIALALAAIFFFGFATGRLTRHQPEPVMTGPRRGQVFNADTLLARELQAVQLTPEQVRALRPVMQKMIREARDTAPRSRERMNILMKFVPEIRKHLEPDQLKAYDRWTEQRRKRMERVLRLRESQGSGPEK